MQNVVLLRLWMVLDGGVTRRGGGVDVDDFAVGEDVSL